MTERQKLREQIKAKREAIEMLRLEIIELRKQDYLLSDDERQYIETEEIISRGKSECTALIGRIYWKQKFTDEEDNPSVVIDRQRIVKVDGKWHEFVRFHD